MNYYEILGISRNASIEQIKNAYERKRKEYSKTNNNRELANIEEAYQVLKDNKKRNAYNRIIKKRKQKKNRKIALTAAGLAFVACVGYCLVKDSKIKGYISELPEDLKVGSYCPKDSRVSKFDMNKDFVLIEIPDYDEDVSEKSRFVKNVAKCIANKEEFGIYLKTCAKTKDEFNTIISRFNSLSNKYNWFSAYPIIIDLEYQDELDSKDLSFIINEFNTILKNGGWYPEFCIRNDILNLDESIKTVLLSDNKELTSDEIEYNSAFTYNSTFFGRVLRNSDFSSKNIDIFSRNYTDEIRNGNYNGYSNQQYYVGVDISGYQLDIDWEKISTEIDFSICRICDFYGYDSSIGNFYDVLDTTYTDKINNCVKYNIPFASYYYTRANTVDMAKDEAKEIVRFMDESGLRGTRIYLDVESYKNSFVAELITNNDPEIIKIIYAAKNIIEESGYEFGLYINNSDLIEVCKAGHLKNMPLWIANYGADVRFDINSHIDSSGQLKGYVPLQVNNPTSCDTYIQQITQNGVVDGLGNADGKVDINLIPISNGLDGFTKDKPRIYYK